MQCAVVDSATSIVVNIIVAQPDDVPPEGCFLVALDDTTPCSIGWVYADGVFVDPNPPPPDETPPE